MLQPLALFGSSVLFRLYGGTGKGGGECSFRSFIRASVIFSCIFDDAAETFHFKGSREVIVFYGRVWRH